MVAAIADDCDILCLPIGQEINSICQRSGPRERSECRGWGGVRLWRPFPTCLKSGESEVPVLMAASTMNHLSP